MTANDFKMTRKTANKIINELTAEGRKAVTLKKAIVTFPNGARRERFCMFLGGVKISSAKDWNAYNTPNGFHKLMIAKLHQ